MSTIIPTATTASTATPADDGFPPLTVSTVQRVTRIAGPALDDLTDAEFATLAEHVQRYLDDLLAESGHATRATVTALSGGAR